MLFTLLLGSLIAAAFGLMNQVPGGFVPPKDQGNFIGSVQLPAAASLNRTSTVTEKVDAILTGIPGMEKRLVINGYNVLNGVTQSDSALFVAKLKPWGERTAPEEQLKSIILATYRQASRLPEAVVLAFNPPPIPGLGAAGVSWEIDLWGCYRRASEAAQAEMLASAEARHGINASLVGAVANYYYQLAALRDIHTVTAHAADARPAQFHPPRPAVGADRTPP